MKRVVKYIGIAIITIGCTTSEIIEYTPTDGEISFLAGVTTRVDAEDDTKWKSDGTDQVGIFTNQSSESNLEFLVTSTGTMTNESGQELKILGDGERVYYAYHPYSSEQSGPTMATTCVTDQSTPLLWAEATSNETKVELLFKHMLPKVTFNLTAGGADVSDLTGAKATLKGAYGNAHFYIADYGDYQGGEFYSHTAYDITLDIASDDTITAYLIPMEDENYKVSDNVKLWITAGNDTYIYPIDTDYWLRGNKYEYKITVGAKNSTDNNND